jgi:hypothetical protein
VDDPAFFPADLLHHVGNPRVDINRPDGALADLQESAAHDAAEGVLEAEDAEADDQQHKEGKAQLRPDELAKTAEHRRVSLGWRGPRLPGIRWNRLARAFSGQVETGSAQQLRYFQGPRPVCQGFGGRKKE